MDTRPCIGRLSARLTHRWDSDEPIVMDRTPCEETTNLFKGQCKFCCDICHEFWNNVAAGAFTAAGQLAMTKFAKHRKDDHGIQPTTTHKGNGAHIGAFAFTLTKSPNDDLTEADLLKAVRKVMNQQSKTPTKFVWYLEYGDNDAKTHSHIHGMYETVDGGRIEAKHWKRAWPIWDEKNRMGSGFRGGYHRPVRSEENYSDYIKKCGGIHQIFNIS
jgi:hypothetical protein